uniref:Uncharacterized protein n=1 Tax=Hyaloperonospora arabidopsidis (strain Emoy2) TaxID=559515 RepID=M4BC28_HYAAE
MNSKSDANCTPQPAPVTTANDTETSHKSNSRSHTDLLKSPRAYEQKPLRMPKPLSI